MGNDTSSNGGAAFDIEQTTARVRTLIGERRATEALALSEALCLAHPRSIRAARVRLRALIHAERTEAALVALRELSARHADSKFELEIHRDLLISWGREAQALHRAGDHAGAAERWRRAASETPMALADVYWYEAAIPYSEDFQLRLATAENAPKTRIYIAGCGRSGTWLTLGVTATFASTFTAPEERHAGHFLAIAKRPEAIHVVKRRYDSHYHLANLPSSIRLLYVLRDPRDVLVSEHLDTPNYISLDRWAAEMKSLERLLASGRQACVVRYEDLVLEPRATQQRISDELGTEIAVPAERFTERFMVDERTGAIMKGLRPPEPSSVGRWRRDPDRRAYIEAQLPEIKAVFGSLADRFGYSPLI